jgi:hypothetical protein
VLIDYSAANANFVKAGGTVSQNQELVIVGSGGVEYITADTVQPIGNWLWVNLVGTLQNNHQAGDLVYDRSVFDAATVSTAAETTVATTAAETTVATTAAETTVATTAAETTVATTAAETTVATTAAETTVATTAAETTVATTAAETTVATTAAETTVATTAAETTVATTAAETTVATTAAGGFGDAEATTTPTSTATTTPASTATTTPTTTATTTENQTAAVLITTMTSAIGKGNMSIIVNDGRLLSVLDLLVLSEGTDSEEQVVIAALTRVTATTTVSTTAMSVLSPAQLTEVTFSTPLLNTHSASASVKRIAAAPVTAATTASAAGASGTTKKSGAKKSSLGAGPIAGIVLGVVAVVGILMFARGKAMKSHKNAIGYAPVPGGITRADGTMV